MKSFLNNFGDFKVIAAIAALAALIGTGSITSTEGLPLLAGAIGLSINTTPGNSGSNPG